MLKLLKFARKSQDDPADEKPAVQAPSKASALLVAEDPLDALLRRCEERGRLAATASLDVIPDPNRMAALEEYARGQVLALHAPAFDPEKNPEDRRRRDALNLLSEHQRLLANDEVRLIGLRREAHREVPAPEALPRVSRPLLTFAIVGFALGFGASLEPLFAQTIDDPPLAWAASLAIGAAVGGLVTWAVFGIQDHGSMEDEE